MIDALYDRRANLQKEAQLIRELCSQDQGTALRALEEMRAGGSLQDGSLASAILSWADLHGVARPAGSLSSRPLCAKQAWRFLQGGSPCRVRPNQPPAPRVAVVEEVTRPNETAEAYPGNHIGRKGDRTP